LSKSSESYRQIFRATSLFGGVQLINIIIGIIRSKVVAVLLGPAGMGIASLLNSAIGLVRSITEFGLGTSAVRDIASAHESKDEIRTSKIVAVFRKLVWFTGLLGTIIAFAFSSQISMLSFGNTDYSWAFKWLSISLLLYQLTSGNLVLLQGTRKLKLLAKANVMGSFLGLFTSIPLYYWYGIDGIVPAIIIAAISTFIVSFYFGRNVEVRKIKVSTSEAFLEGRVMLKMGIALSISGFAATAVAFYVRAHISNYGTLSDVGLYNAGFSIIGTYAGMVFTAMASDYYPRLSGIAHQENEFTSLVNQQAIVAILIITPILVGFIFFGKWLLILLYSEKFVGITEMIQWAAIGVYFKAVSWALGFILLAKGSSTLYLVSELVANSYLLILTVLGYNWFGLNGVGMAFMIGYALFLIQVYVISKVKYNYMFSSQFTIIFILQLSLLSLCFLLVQYVGVLIGYILGVIFLIISLLYSLVEINHRVDIRGLFSK